MTEKIEVIGMQLKMLLYIVCGVTRLTSIWNNLTRKTKGGKPYKSKQNSRKGSDKDVLNFLGLSGAIVIGVEADGNRIGLLLRAHHDNDFRVLRWNLRQGGALDWFVQEEDGSFKQYPASSPTRLAACFTFQALDLDPCLFGKILVLGQVDCTSTPNQSEWEPAFVFPHSNKVLGCFDPRPGWLARTKGLPSMIYNPHEWIAAVVDSAKAVCACYPSRPVVIWIGTASVWEGTGFKSKSELLYRFALATCQGEGLFCMHALVDCKRSHKTCLGFDVLQQKLLEAASLDLCVVSIITHHYLS
jgi:hypothetical protein